MNLLTFFIILIGYFIFKASVALDESTPTSTKKPLPKPKKVDIDEEVSVESYIKAREILNSVDFNNITRTELNKVIDRLSEIDSSEFSESIKAVEFNLLKTTLIEARDILNSKDLESKTTISTREFYKGTLTDEQMEEAEVKVNRALNSDIDEKDVDNMDVVELENCINNWTPLALLSIDDKATRIKKKRELVERLEKEHGFQRGYIPSWDAEEHLYDKYKGDEEKYLDAKIVELQEKNRSHDMYLSEQEREIFKDDTEGGMW